MPKLRAVFTDWVALQPASSLVLRQPGRQRLLKNFVEKPAPADPSQSEGFQQVPLPFVLLNPGYEDLLAIPSHFKNVANYQFFDLDSGINEFGNPEIPSTGLDPYLAVHEMEPGTSGPPVEYTVDPALDFMGEMTVASWG